MRPRLLISLGIAVSLLAGASACAASSGSVSAQRTAAAGNSSGAVVPGSVQQSGPATSASPNPSASKSATSSAKPSPAKPKPSKTTCTVLPKNNVWHAGVTHLPLAKQSAAYVRSIGANAGVHADFGSGSWDGAPIGIPITPVSAGQAKVKVAFQYGSESDKGPYPISKNARIEGGAASKGDRHVLLYDASTCTDYELYGAYPASGSAWKAGSGAIFDLRSNRLRPAGWTSADAAGLPILPGLVTYAEVASGHIDHAIRVTVPASQAAYLWPARHQASSSHDTSLPPMGLRLRLKAGVNISHLPTQARIVAQAMKTYGVIVADNGSPWYISGAPDSHWNNDQLHALGTLTGSDFEAVDESGLRISASSGASR